MVDRSFKCLLAMVGLVLFGLVSEPTARACQSDEGNFFLIHQLIQPQEDIYYHVSNQPLDQASANPLGVSSTIVSPELSFHLKLDQAAVVLTTVPEDSPGYSGGLRAFDIVLQVSGTRPESPEKLDELLTASAGSSVAFVLLRQAEQIPLQLDVPAIANFQIEYSPDTPQEPETATPSSSYRLGVVLAGVDDALRAHLGLPAGHGVLVTEVSPDSAAAKIGCEPNDIFLELDGQTIESESQLRELVQKIADREVVLKLLRRGKTVEVKITPKLEDHLIVSYSESRFTPHTPGVLLQLAPAINRRINQIAVDPNWVVDLRVVEGEGAIFFSPSVQVQDPPQTEGTSNQILQLKNNVAELQTKLSELLSTIEQLEKNLGNSQSKSP